MLKTFRYTSLLLISLFVQMVHGQAPENTKITITETIQSDSISTKDNKKKRPFFIQGAAVSVDLCGLAMKGIGARFANMEASARLNFKEKYFPIFELGVGDCTREGEENNNKFSTTAPYFRIGMDYNFTKKQNGNRFFAGLRYAFSSYKYDFYNPDFKDEVWGIAIPLDLKDVDGKKQWAEIVIGVETKLWSIIRLGYNVRYRLSIKESGIENGRPWYVPGFGRNGGNAWGGTVNLTFDVGKTAKSNKPKLSLPL